MTGAAQTASTASIFTRPRAVRRAASPTSGDATECTVRLTASGSAPEPGADELEPDIQTCHQRRQRKPLKGVPVVGLQTERRPRPLAQQAVIGAACGVVLQDRQRREPQPGFMRI